MGIFLYISHPGNDGEPLAHVVRAPDTLVFATLEVITPPGVHENRVQSIRCRASRGGR
jgi:hypothetical protein